MEKMRQWGILTAVGVLVVFALGWFLLVSPQRSHAADLRGKATEQQSTNDSLRAQVAALEAQKKGLPAQQKLLAGIATKIPDNPQLPTLIRQLSAAAQTAGVDLVTLAPSQPGPAAPAATASASGVTTGAGTTGGASAPTLLQIPVSVTVSGTYFNLTQFFRNIEKLERAMLVPSFSVSPGAAGAADGAKAGPSDQLTATLSAVVYESPPTASATTSPATAGTTTTAAQ